MALGVNAVLAAVGLAYLGEVVSVWPLAEDEGRSIRGIVHHTPAWAAWGLAGAGAAAAIWGWSGRQTRGTRRCRRCWYDMSGIGLRCPECGFVAPEVRHLYRPRRRRVVMGVGVLFLAGAYAAWMVPRVRSGGWVAAVPTTVLIAGMELWPERALVRQFIRSREEDWSLGGRISSGRVLSWQRAWARARARGLVLSEGDPRVVTAAMLLIPYPRDADLSNACFRCLARELGSEDEERREIGARCTGALWGWMSRTPHEDHEAARLAPGLIRALEDGSDAVFQASCMLLRAAGPSAEAAVPHLMRQLSSADQRRRMSALMALQGMASASRAVREGALETIRGRDKLARQGAIMLLKSAPRNDTEVTDALLAVLRGPDHEESRRAASALRKQAPPSVAIPALFEQFRSERPQRDEYLQWLTPSLRDPEFDRELEKWVPELVATLNSSVPLERGAAWYVLCNSEPRRIDLSGALGAIDAIQNDPNAEIAAQAKYIASRIRAKQAWDAELQEGR